MTITYKKRSIKKARTKKKVFGNKKQTYKRSKNKWSLRRKRGGMDNDDPKKQKIGSPVLAPVADSTSTRPGALLADARYLQSDSLGSSQFDSPSNSSGAMLGVERPTEMLHDEVEQNDGLDQTYEVEPNDGLNDNERYMVNKLFDDINNDKKEQTDGSCENEINMGNELLDDINDDDLANLDAAEIDNLKAVTGFADLDAVVTGDQHDGLVEAGEAPKTPIKQMYTRKKVIERLKDLLETPQKQARPESSFAGTMEPRILSLTPGSQEYSPAPAPASSSSSAARVRATRSPDFTGIAGTPEVITSCSTEIFLDVLVLYLNIKKKRWRLALSTLENCWENLFVMYEKRGFKKGFKDRIVKYSNSTLFDKSIFSRNVFQQFVIDCVDYGVAEEMKVVKNVGRDAFKGEPLKSACVLTTEAKGGFLYTSPEDVPAGNPKKNLNKVEIDWIKKCIGERNQLWIDNHSLRKSDKPDYQASLDDMKENMDSTYKNWTYWKKVCGICWICKKPIYFYYMTEHRNGSGQKIDLNTQCGQIEHVLPPTIGDIFGTLHNSASIFKKVVAANGRETMYTYGLEPSHAFCNQMKGMFVFTPILFGGNVTGNWTKEVESWFRNERYDSFEFYPGFIQTWEDFHVNEATTYANTTFHNVNDYLRENIKTRLTEQAAHPGHTMKSVTQLKLAIFCQKFAYENSPIFKKKWDGKADAATATGR